MESSKSFYIFCGLAVTVVGIGGGSAAAADGHVAGVAAILISIPLAGLCFATALRDLKDRSGLCPIPPLNVSGR